MGRIYDSSLTKVPFFSGLDHKEIEQFIPLFQTKKYNKKSIIFLEGAQGTEFFIIKSGAVEVYRIDLGKKITLAFLQEGDFFGEMALLQPTGQRSATVETLEPTILYSLRREDFERLLQAKPKLVVKLLGSTMERLREANEQIQDLTFFNVRERVIKTIVRLADKFGKKHSTGVIIDFKLTHQQLADAVGAVRETVTKILLELQDNNIIEIKKKKILLKDLTKLNEIISS